MTADAPAPVKTSAASSLQAMAEEILARHTRVERVYCRAESLGPITVQHQFSGGTTPTVLHCTNERHEEGNHRDGAHCWRAHDFTRDQAGKPEDRDESICSCGRAWPGAWAHPGSNICDAAGLALAILDAAPVEP